MYDTIADILGLHSSYSH